MCRLPSFTEAFTASVPLTRIRDIAHRNDIPHDLKLEIKHTLQVGPPLCTLLSLICLALQAELLAEFHIVFVVYLLVRESVVCKALVRVPTLILG